MSYLYVIIIQMVWGLNRLSNLFFWPQLYNNILIFSYSCVRAAFQLMPAGGLKYLPNTYLPTNSFWQGTVLWILWELAFHTWTGTGNGSTLTHMCCHGQWPIDWWLVRIRSYQLCSIPFDQCWQLTCCVSLTCQCCRLVKQRPCHVLSCLCESQC